MQTASELFGDRAHPSLCQPDLEIHVNGPDSTPLYAHRFIVSTAFPVLQTFMEIDSSNVITLSSEVAQAVGLTRDIIAGALAFAYISTGMPGAEEACSALSQSQREDVIKAMHYLGASISLQERARGHNKCVCCYKELNASDKGFDKLGCQLCPRCFGSYGDRTPATLDAMFMLGFKPFEDDKVQQLCEAIETTGPPERKTCRHFRDLLRQHLGHIYEFGVPDLNKRLTDEQAQKLSAALQQNVIGGRWCTFVHLTIYRLCALPGNYRLVDPLDAGPKQWATSSARHAKATSTGAIALCDAPYNRAGEAWGRPQLYINMNNTCAAMKARQEQQV